MPLAQLISPQQLAERLKAGGVVILDCRFALEDPDYGRCSYAEGHIEGAQYADLERHLSGPVTKGVTGRHPLPAADTLVQQLRAWGISADTDIVLYDDGPGAYAARAWWLLAWLGKRLCHFYPYSRPSKEPTGIPLTDQHRRAGARSLARPCARRR